MKAALVLAFLATYAAAGARAQELTADLSSHLVAITTGFTGTSVVLFGATDGPSDVIAVVRGPESDVAIRRKSRIAGIWLNARALTFTGVPSFYALYASRPLDEIAPPAMQTLHQFGIAALRLGGGEDAVSPAERDVFHQALLDEEMRQGLYLKATGRVAFLGDRLFRATIDFPKNVPTGGYIVEVYLVRQKAVVSAQTTPLVVSQTGVDAAVDEFARRDALAYGLLAAAGAAIAGWLASLPFRNA